MTDSKPARSTKRTLEGRWQLVLAALLVHWLAPALHDGQATPLHWLG